jgi:hypothetical protein
MQGTEMKKVAEAMEGIGYIVKELKEEEYSQYDRPVSGEKYTGLFLLKIRTVADEQADAERKRLRIEQERMASKPAHPADVEPKEVPF